MNYKDKLPPNSIADSVECAWSLNWCVWRNGSPDGSRDLVFYESGKFLISGERESAPLRAGHGNALFNEGSGVWFAIRRLDSYSRVEIPGDIKGGKTCSYNGDTATGSPCFTVYTIVKRSGAVSLAFLEIECTSWAAPTKLSPS